MNRARRRIAAIAAMLLAVGLPTSPAAANGHAPPIEKRAASAVAAAARAEVLDRWSDRTSAAPPVTFDFDDSVTSAEQVWLRAGTIGTAQYWAQTEPITMAVGDHQYAADRYNEMFDTTNGYDAMTGGRGAAGVNGVVMNIEGLRVDWNRLQTAPHEVTHVAQYRMAGSTGGQDRMAPCWFTEGLALFYGYNLGSLATNLDYEMARGRAIDELHMWGPLEDYSTTCDGSTMGPYITGFFATEYLVGTYGQDAYVDYQASRAGGATWQSAFSAAYGLSPSDFFQRYETYRAATIDDHRGGYPPQPGVRDTTRYACPPDEIPDSGFVDIAGNTFEAQIHCIADHGITTGGPGGLAADAYGPSLAVTRGQMATFLVRMLTSIGPGVLAPYDGVNRFTDVAGANPHLESINRLAAAGIVNGGAGGRPTTSFSPNTPVARGQMASFIARALGATFSWGMCHPDAVRADYFGDDDGSAHERCTNDLVELGVVGGTGPGRFNPKADVLRGQMAAFVMRAVDLANEVSSRSD